MDIVKNTHSTWWQRPRARWLLAGTLALGVVLLIPVLFGTAAPTVERAQLWIDSAQQGQMKREIRANGVLVPRQIRWITAVAAASVQEVVVEAGTRVAADSVILRLANPELQANLDKAQAALAGEEAGVAATQTALASQLLDQQAAQAQAESDWRIAEIKLRALEQAYEAGITPLIELEQSRIVEQQSQHRLQIQIQRTEAFRRNMAAQLQAARAKRDEARSALEVIAQQVESLNVRAGIDGILQQVEVEPGQRIATGDTLARVAQPDELIARLQVSEVLAKDLALELPVSVDTRNGIAQGRLIRVDPAVRNGTVTADVAFDGPLPEGARPDLSVDGRILLGTLHDVVSIGRPASIAPDSTAALFVIAPGEDLARRVPLQLGAVSSDRVEVKSGLRAGEQVVLSDVSQWQDYDELRLK